jgi:hypothetical protein
MTIRVDLRRAFMIKSPSFNKRISTKPCVFYHKLIKNTSLSENSDNDFQSKNGCKTYEDLRKRPGSPFLLITLSFLSSCEEVVLVSG